MNKYPYNGFINVYKEKGFTSMDVCAKLRGILGMRKIGHAGTLDPMAEGVLPVALGRATKDIEKAGDGSKTYRARLLLGTVTDTQDVTGNTLKKETSLDTSEEELRAAIYSFLGKYEQLTPMYSARKVGGKKLYEYARKGIEVERKKKLIEIFSIEIEDIELPRATFKVSCSKGTYIRTLCHDIGKKLGCGACMEALTRLRVGDFRIEESLKLSDIEKLRDEGRVDEALSICSDTALALGKFDGAHIGHRRIFKKLQNEAGKRRLKSCVVMLDREEELLSQRELIKRELYKLDIDYVFKIKLTDEYMSMYAEGYLRDILKGRYGMKLLCAGPDVSFGYKREGDAAFLKSNEARYDYTFIPVEKLKTKEGKTVSSSLIKERLRAGRLKEVRELLGRNYSITGRVVHGRHLGAKVLGFPTMNLKVPKGLALPPYGVYAVRLAFIDRYGDDIECYGGIADLGEKPTVEISDIYKDSIWLETYAFDYDGDAYGKKIRVELCEFIRPEQKFGSLEELRKQLLENDVDEAKKLLAL